MEGFQKIIFDVPRIGIYVRFVDFFSRGAINVVLYKKHFMQISGSDNLNGKQALERNEVNSRNETYLVSN